MNQGRILAVSLCLAFLGACSDDASNSDPSIDLVDSTVETDAGESDATVPMDAEVIDECATDNGGCGDSNLYDCSDTPDAPPVCTLDSRGDYLELVRNVRSIESGDSLPDNLVVHGRSAFPLVVDERGRSFAAAGRFGEGKVLVMGHESYIAGLLEGPGDSGTLVNNALKWMRGDGPLNIAATGGLGELAGFLEAAGHTVRVASPNNLSDIDVLCVSSHSEFSPTAFESIRAFVRDGGGLIMGGQAWWWAYSTGGTVATDYPGNLILNPMGITMGGLGEISGGTDMVSPEPLSDLHHAAHGLDALIDHIRGVEPLEAEALALAAETVSIAMRVLALNHPWYEQAHQLLNDANAPTPTADAPIRPEDDPIARVTVSLQTKLAAEAEADALPMIPAAESFPGAVGDDAETVDVRLTIDGNYEGRSPRYAFSNPNEPVWRSTGLYLARNTILTVHAPQAAIDAGIDVQIGCHTDELWDNEEWLRYPELTRRWPLTGEVTRVGSSFGGPVYIRVPIGAQAGMVELGLEGAVPMPRYVHGQMTNEEWLRTERDLPAPWAEFEGTNFILTVPAELAREVEDPDDLMTFWTSVLDSAADLAAIDRNRARAERFVLDRQISLGWMHSGYPLMAYVAASSEFLDVDRVREEGAWGPFHEIGHNHQFYDTVLPGTTESTVNLWSVYVSENILNLSRDLAHDALTAENRTERMAAYLATGPDFSQWSVWTALETYLQLQTAFGWDFYIDLFAEYLEIPAGQAPQEDADRINEWVVRSSRRAGFDLGPFYEAWGMPMSDEARDEMATQPFWPANPM